MCSFGGWVFLDVSEVKPIGFALGFLAFGLVTGWLLAIGDGVGAEAN